MGRSPNLYDALGVARQLLILLTPTPSRYQPRQGPSITASTSRGNSNTGGRLLPELVAKIGKMVATSRTAADHVMWRCGVVSATVSRR